MAPLLMALTVLSCQKEEQERQVARINKDSLFAAVDSLHEYYMKYEGGRGHSSTQGWQNLTNADHSKPKQVKKKGKGAVKAVANTIETEQKGPDNTDALLDSLVITTASTSNNSDDSKGELSNAPTGNGLLQSGSGGYEPWPRERWDNTGEDDDDYTKDSHELRRWEIGADAAHLLVGGINFYMGYRVSKQQQLALSFTGAWFGNDNRNWLHRFLIWKSSYAFYLNKSNKFKGFHVGPYFMWGHYQLLRASWDKRWVGNFLSTGVQVGYRIKLSLSWAMDVNLSLGYLYSPFHNSEKIGKEFMHTYDGTTNYFGPTDLNIRFAKTMKWKKITARKKK